MSFVRHVLFLGSSLLPCRKLFDCSSCGGPVIPGMYAVDVSHPVRDLSLSQGKPSSTSEGENPVQSLRGHMFTTPSSPAHVSYWPLQSWKCPASLIQRHHLPMPAPHKVYLLRVTPQKKTKMSTEGLLSCRGFLLFFKIENGVIVYRISSKLFFFLRRRCFHHLKVVVVLHISVPFFFARIWRQISLPALVHSHYYSLPSL